MGPYLLRDRVAALRLSLLAAAGLVPLACGGALTGDSNGEHGGDSGSGGTRISSKPAATAGRTSGSGTAPVTGTGGTGPIAVAGSPGSGFPTCTAPELDPVSGLVTCQEGYEHRPIAVACDVPGENPGELPAAGGAGGGGGDSGGLPRADGTVHCRDDTSLCDAFDLGYCEDSGGGGGTSLCQSGCRIDQECQAREICICEAGSTSGGRCVPSDCTTNVDCQKGYNCASYTGGCGFTGFACQTPEDQCFGTAECTGRGEECYPDLGPRTCAGLYACGRPFLVEQTARYASVVASDAWSSQQLVLPRLDQLTHAERDALAKHWTRMGQMEHASIAAFARFALQLLSLGAPPELIEDCTRALADETAHAKLCFELASAYAGRAIAPGPLDISGSLVVTTLTDIVDLVLLEGCIGETSAALEALEAAANAHDPVIAAAYARIAEDEERHAALAFRFVRWALEREPRSVKQRILEMRRSAPIQHSSARDVVVPCLDALLDLARVSPTQELFT